MGERGRKTNEGTIDHQHVGAELHFTINEPFVL